jgi:hypothetical protein
VSQVIFPLDQPTAQALLEAADVAGHPAWVVQATADGFVVPDDVADIFHHGGVRPDQKKAAPRSRSRKPVEKE